MPPVYAAAHPAIIEFRSSSTSKTAPPILQTAIVVLAATLLAISSILVVIRARSGGMESDEATTEYLILESEVCIEIGEDGFDLEYEDEDGEGRISYETILSSATPHRMAFDIDKLPTIYVERRDSNIQERRGKKTLKLRPSTSGSADMALIDIKEGRLTVSPFSSRKDGSVMGTEFPPPRKRTPRAIVVNNNVPPGIATAPYQLQNNWRPLDTAELPNHKS